VVSLPGLTLRQGYQVQYFPRHSGFVQEVVERKARWLDGGWADMILMGILAEEWEERQNGQSMGLIADEGTSNYAESN